MYNKIKTKSSFLTFQLEFSGQFFFENFGVPPFIF